MAVLIAVVISVFVSVAHNFFPSTPSGPCVGGPVSGSGQSVGNGDYKFNCSGGGSVVVHVGN